MAIPADLNIVPRWVTPEEIKAGIKDRYSPKQAEILAEFKKAPELSSENIGEHGRFQISSKEIDTGS